MDSSQKKKLLDQMLDESVFKLVVDKTFSDADLDKNGIIDYSEFAIVLKGLHSTLSIPPPTEAEIKKEFKKLDINNDDKIDKNEFEMFVRELIRFCVEIL